MNIAIIIGVSEYTDKQNNLPGCQKDAFIINEVINKAAKYDNILYINESISSAKLKEKFTEFISEQKTNDIEELFFYFTGHGEFIEDEFYYILSDFNDTKRKQTSLQNNEVDSLFKTLKPNLVIKVIDACQSGKAYIKESDVVDKYFNKTGSQYNNCYFLHSSLNTQSSYQTDTISDFTSSFIHAIKQHTTKDIRYKDIIDFISDEFEKKPLQTPFFVVQADYTEKFCTISDILKEYLKDVDSESDLGQTDKVGVVLLNKIKEDATQYFTKDQALMLIDEMRKKFEQLTISEELHNIFDLSISFSDSYSDIVQKNIIGQWLDDNPHDFFAKSTFKTVKKGRYNPVSSFLSLRDFSKYNEDDYEVIRSGFEIEVEVPYKTIVFILESKYPNVESFTLRIIYFLSKRSIRFFYFITNYETKNWDEKVMNSKIEWRTSEFLISDESQIFQGIEKIFTSMTFQVEKELRDKFEKED
ncbi:caspase family protein [Flavobacterium sp.]|uniref:caspase family protein n=1 Tax=Flavobacterium sp. TaxID=239 RepID=UPI003A91A772